ncbi:hypothetical protein AB0G87_38915 [Streptomyces asoensis]
MPLDAGKIDPAAGGVLEGAVVGGAVDAPHLLVGQGGGGAAFPPSALMGFEPPRTPGSAKVHWMLGLPVVKRWHPQVINAPPTGDHVIVEAQVRDYGLSPAQQDEVWRRWREGQSFSLIARALGAPMQSARRFLCQNGGVRLARKHVQSDI